MTSFSPLEHDLEGSQRAPDSASPLRLDVLGPQGETLRSLDLQTATLTIGQAPGNQLVLEAEGVSRYHLRLTSDGTRVTVTDLGGRNGTLLNDQRLTPHVETAMAPGGIVRVGPFRLRLSENRAAHTATTVLEPTLSPSMIGLSIAGGRETLEITPGQPAVVVLLLTNNGTATEYVKLGVEGIPAEWLRLPEEAVAVAIDSPLSLPIQILAPQEPESRASDYGVLLSARPQSDPTNLSTVHARWTVLPFAASEAAIRPRKRVVRGQATATYLLAIENNGNQPVSFTLQAGDDEPSLDYLLDQSRVLLEPGTATTVRIGVQARENPTGRTQNYNFSVRVQPSVGPALLAPAQLSQLRPFPVWAAVLITLVLLSLLGGAALAWTLFQDATRDRVVQAAGATPSADDDARTPTIGSELSIDAALRGTQTAAAVTNQLLLQQTEQAGAINAAATQSEQTVEALTAALNEAQVALTAQAQSAQEAQEAQEAQAAQAAQASQIAAIVAQVVGASGGGAANGSGASGGSGTSDSGTSGSGASGSVPAVLPTYTPYPTYTPFPTSTPTPNITTTPTNLPTVPPGVTATAVPPPPQSKIVFVTTSNGANSIAGRALSWSPAVQIQDQSTNLPITNYTGFVSISLLSDGCSQTPKRPNNLKGTLQVSFVNGQAVFSNVQIECAATYTLQASVDGIAPATSDPFTVVPAQASLVSATFSTALPDRIPAESALPALVVRVLDEFSNQIALNDPVTISLKAPDASSDAILNGTLTRNLASGTATFSGLEVDRIGTGYALQATVGTVSGLSPAFTIGANQLLVTVRGSSFVANTSTISVTVSAIDALGTIDQTFRDPVTLAITGTNGVALTPSTGLRLNAKLGTITFKNLSANFVGAYTITASGGTLSGVSDAFNITADRLRFAVQPRNTPAGEALLFTVEAGDGVRRDPTFNGSTCTFTLQTGPPAGALILGSPSATPITLAMNAGTASFVAPQDLHIRTQASGYSIAASCTRSGGLSNLSAVSTTFTITASLARSLAIVAVPAATQSVDNAFAVQVAALDRWGAQTPAFTQTTTLALTVPNPASALSSTITTSFANGNGAATFSTRIQKVGSYQLIAQSAGGLVSPPSVLFTMGPGAATELIVATQPAATAVAGNPVIAVTLDAQDQYGNFASGFNGAVRLQLTNPNGALLYGPASATPGLTWTNALTVTASAGQVSFNAIAVDRVGTNYTFSASSSTIAAAALSSPFSISADVPDHIVFTTPPPTNPVAGAGFTVGLKLIDRFGNDAAFSTDQVVNVQLGGTIVNPVVAAVTFNANTSTATSANITLTQAGPYTLTSTTATPGLLANTQSNQSNNLTVVAAAASKILFTTQPPSKWYPEGLFDITVQTLDAFNNPANSTASIDLDLFQGATNRSERIGGQQTTTLVNGVGTFSVSVSQADLTNDYTLQVTSAGLNQATSIPFRVNPAQRLRFLTQPFFYCCTAYVYTEIEVIDYNDLRIGTANGTMTMTILDQAGEPSGVAASVFPSGLTTYDFFGGIAGFYVYVDRVGEQSILQVDVAGMDALISNAFAIP